MSNTDPPSPPPLRPTPLGKPQSHCQDLSTIEGGQMQLEIKSRKCLLSEVPWPHAPRSFSYSFPTKHLHLWSRKS